MIPLLVKLSQDPERKEQFARDCGDWFSSARGRRVMETLLWLANPAETPLRQTSEQTHVAIGQKEIVALMWQHAPAQEFNPHSVTQPALSDAIQTPSR